METKQKEVAIIGAGPCGLLAAKYSLQNSLVPVVYEKSSSVGGIWSQVTTSWIHETNLTKYTMMFSDHPWSNEISLYPSGTQVLEYFQSYATKFNLEKHVKFRNQVNLLRFKEDTQQWEMTIQDLETNEIHVKSYEYCIIASGQHQKPYIPVFEDQEKFNGLVLHSKEYFENDPRLESKRVVVIGSSFSANQIASSLAGHASSVTNIYSRPYILSSRYIKKQIDHKKYQILPLDWFAYKRKFNYPTPGDPENQEKQVKELLKGLFNEQIIQDQIHPELYINVNDPQYQFLLCVSNNYLEVVKENKILPKIGKIQKFVSDGIILEDNTYIPADVIIYGTGFQITTDFLDSHIIEQIKFHQGNYRLQILLYKFTVHPNLQNIGFMGQYESLLFSGFEMQAKWLTQIFSGKRQLPSKEEMIQEIEKDRQALMLKLKSQNPHGASVSMSDKIASEIQILPNFQELQENQPELFNIHWNLYQQQSYIFNPNQNIPFDFLEKVNELDNFIYEFNCEPHELTNKKITQAFLSKYRQVFNVN